jgi:hypothetical protein
LAAVSDPTLERAGGFDIAGKLADDFAPATLAVELMRVPEPPDRRYVASVRRRLAEARVGALLLIEDASSPSSAGVGAVPAG